MTHVNKSGKIRGVKFLIKDYNTIRIWKPSDVSMDNFKEKCNYIIKYLIDEGFFDKKHCRVEVINTDK